LEFVSNVEVDCLKAGMEEKRTTLQGRGSVNFPGQFLEAGKDIGSWAAIFEDGKYGRRDIVGGLVVRNTLNTLAILDDSLPVLFTRQPTLYAMNKLLDKTKVEASMWTHQSHTGLSRLLQQLAREETDDRYDGVQLTP